MPLANRVIGVDPKPNEDGDNVIKVILGDESRFDVAIDLGAAQMLVEILQRRLVLWAHKSAKNLRLPQFAITEIDVSHKGPDAQLMVTTSQIGVVVAVMSDELLRKARQETDRVLTYRSGPQTKQ